MVVGSKKCPKSGLLKERFPHFKDFSTKIYLVIHGFYNSRFSPSPKNANCKDLLYVIFKTQLGQKTPKQIQGVLAIRVFLGKGKTVNYKIRELRGVS